MEVYTKIPLALGRGKLGVRVLSQAISTLTLTCFQRIGVSRKESTTATQALLTLRNS